ncbi:type III secretion system apparatus protein VscT2 [Vibrio parahaemolyticus]|uniref:type III secretion system apparatus protein VscT2 n=1 Tax=Vibrio parahaemolyticus TaxID=670 RepID=UPI001869AB27|nr:type III secretion system apparatus protein VscT2 [Vibrio parahaemolyticus]MBE4089735.1 type III secretion system apparatus protein VscT2 [Vibrio parahaemolyticus]MCQ9091965.1 type III secretion system apparatus protein VscT2 [Vibrio parahaemolyticus]
MEALLFPNWMLFAGLFLFLKVYEPTRLYLDNTCCLAIAITCAMFVDRQLVLNELHLGWVVAVVMFALLMSVPYLLGGMVGSVIQQLLLLNEQSVQDKRFTDESESLAKISSLLMVYYALNDGTLFWPLLQLLNAPSSIALQTDFAKLFFFITDSLGMLVVVSGKYIVLMIVTTVCCGYVDLFFKKASLSQFVTPNVKAVLVVILLNLWFLNDQFYVFKQLMQKVGYE